MAIELPPYLASLNIQPPWVEDCSFQRMVFTESGEFYPLLSAGGYDIYNAYTRHLLTIGNRKSGKSLAIANKCMRHLWETDGAIVAVVCRTTKNAKIGVWRDFMNFVLPGWKNAGFGLEIKKQGTDAVSKMEYCRIVNAHGSISEIQLHSIDFAFDAEAKFKGGRFSMVWLSEADQFEDRIVFDILTDQLRVVGIPYEQHQIICDCNWPEEGDDSWLHSVFEKSKDPSSKYYRDNYHEEFRIIKSAMADNPFLDPREKADLERKYAHDKIKYQRYVKGDEWVKDVSSGLFDSNFFPEIHIIGKAESEDKSKWETITPYKGARFLLTGTDTGSLNHATTFLCPRVDPRDEVCYDIFDEVVSIEKQVSIKNFAKEVWERVQKWQDWMMKTYNLTKPPEWRHFADSSLWNFNSGANCNDAEIFWSVSNGGMGLRAAIKGQDSIRQRIEMTRRLFHDNRLFISAHCHWNIGWARYLKPGRAKNQPISQASMHHKHTWDSATYALAMSIPYEIQSENPSVAMGIIST